MLATRLPRSGSSPDSLLGTSACDLKFQVRGGEHDGRVIRIAAAKCTIGSAAGCTLRLHGKAIQPLHCLILSGRKGTAVRRCSPDTYLNGGAFEDALLQAGDVLHVGPVELVVISCAQPAAAVNAVEQEPIPENHDHRLDSLASALTQARVELVQSQESHRRAEEEWIADRARLECEKSVLLAQLQHRQTELEEFRASAVQVDSAKQAPDQFQQDLKAAHEERQAAERAWREQDEQRATAHQALADQLGQRTQELEHARRSVESQMREATASLEKVRSEMLAAECEAAQRQEQLDRLQTQVEALRQARDQFAAQALQLGLELQESAAKRQVLEERLSQQMATPLEHPSDTNESAMFWKQKAADAEKHLERWQAEAHQRQLLAENLREQMAQAQDAARQAQEESRRLSSELSKRQTTENDLRQLAARMEVETEQATLEISRLHDLLSARQKEFVALQTQAQEGLGAERADLQEQVAELARNREQQRAEQAASAARQSDSEGQLREKEALVAERAAVIAMQMEQLEAERSAFARQQAMLIQQMTALEDRVQELSTSESRKSNSPFAIPRLDHLNSIEGDVEPSDHPYVRRGDAAIISDALDLDAAPPAAVMPSMEVPDQKAEVAAIDASDSQVESVVSRLMQAGIWKNEPAEAAAEAEERQGEAAPPTKYQPTSFLDQAAEMARAEDEAGESSFGSLQRFPEEPVAIPDAAPKAAPSMQSHEDDSIEQYMAKLLNRVRRPDGQSGNSAPGNASPSPTSAPAAPPPEPAANFPEFVEPAEFIPRAQAPEQTIGFSAMRELANSAARSALHAHAERRVKRKAKSRSLVAVLSLIGGVGLGATALATSSLLAWGGSVTFFVLCGVSSMRAIQEAIQHMRLTTPRPADEPGEDQVAPETAQDTELNAATGDPVP